MAVTAHPKDVQGKVLDTKVANLTAALAAINPASAGVAAKLASDLDQAQRETVSHYMAKGRITAASVLSTLS